MPFDAGPKRYAPPAPKPFKDEPIDWLDWGLRIVVIGPFLVLYTAWIGHIAWMIISGL